MYNLKELEVFSNINAILKEAYSTPNLDWVKDLIDYLFNSPQISENYVLNKWNLKLEFTDYDDYTVIDEASYSPETNIITLYINNKLDNYLNANKISKEKIIFEFKRYIFHEVYHYQQGNNEYKGKKPSKEDRYKRFKPFYNKELTAIERKLLVQEVDAHTKDIAKILKDNNYTIQEAIRSLELNNLNINLFDKIEIDEINLYRSHPAQWKRFLKEIYNYYELER